MTAAPQAGARRPVAVPVAALGLTILGVLTLRGTLPDLSTAGPRQANQSGPASQAGILILLSASMLIIAVALLTRPPRPAKLPIVEERPVPAGSGVWSLRRLLVIGVGVALAALLIVLLLNQFGQVASLRLRQPPDPALPPDRGLPAPTPRPAPSAPSPGAGDSPVLVWLAGTVAVMAVLMIASAVLARLRRPGTPSVSPPPASPPGGEPQSLAVAAERGLAEVEDLSRSPREAIIACYVVMERALLGAPGAAPQDSDTPSEVLARAVANRTLRTEDAAALVEVFAEARFSTHTMTETHREAAERALRGVLSDLRAVR